MTTAAPRRRKRRTASEYAVRVVRPIDRLDNPSWHVELSAGCQDLGEPKPRVRGPRELRPTSLSDLKPAGMARGEGEDEALEMTSGTMTWPRQAVDGRARTMDATGMDWYDIGKLQRRPPIHRAPAHHGVVVTLGVGP